MKNVQCPFRRFRSSSLMRGNQCGKERKEARRILHSRAKCFDIFFLNIGVRFISIKLSTFCYWRQFVRTKNSNSKYFFPGFLSIYFVFYFCLHRGFLELILRKHSFLCFLCQKCLFWERKCLLLTQLEKRSFFQ